ncbi:hypothetical protein [Pseudomonas lutea]|uniref:Uncharacterized protein n=1 Tax=Pseudomonas lutea TaxID=243924 RepID=A0A9X0JGV3_9PSED|nr:hypothetical protein [Pseudomonas lutea]KGF62098.1 hypothetical protein LT42_25415 [Pseudomonas lutea]
MAVARRIAFRESAMFDSSIYAAMVADQIESFDHDALFGVIETFDAKGSDYPFLREALRSAQFSFAVYQQREGEGDHVHWKYSLEGEKENYSSSAPGPIQFVRDLTR